MKIQPTKTKMPLNSEKIESDWALKEYGLGLKEINRIADKLQQSGEQTIQKGEARPIKELLSKYDR
jgi:hypothetical protein